LDEQNPYHIEDRRVGEKSIVFSSALFLIALTPLFTNQKKNVIHLTKQQKLQVNIDGFKKTYSLRFIICKSVLWLGLTMDGG